MKRFCIYFPTALLAFSVGVFVSVIRNYEMTSSEAPNIPALSQQSPCAPDTFTVKHQPQAMMQLEIVEANCNGSSWNARLTLQNIGTKAVRGYEVANLEDYEYKKGLRSSQGVRANVGVVLAAQEIKTLTFGAGFQAGLSYGKPTGSIQKNVFWIKRVEYCDGTVWQADQNRQ